MKWETLKNTKKGLMTDYLVVSDIDERLKSYLGISTERELLDVLGSDFYYMSVRDISQNEGFTKCYKKKLQTDDKYRECALGIKWLRVAYDSKFVVDEAVESPLENAVSSKDILSYPFPYCT